MLRLLLYISALLLVAVGLASLAEMPGTVAIEWMGWYIETSLLFVWVVLGAFLLLLFVLYRLIDTLLGLPGRYRRARYIENQERGLSVLTEAFSALAVSDIASARKLNRRASKLLGSPPITHLLAAQLARLENDGEEAETHLRPLLEHRETRFLATRGLLEQARANGDIESAIRYAEDAAALRPGSTFAAISLIDLYTREQRWQQAQDVVRKARKQRAISHGEAKRYQALIHYQHALNLFAREEYDMALYYVRTAHKALPDAVPVALLLVRCYARLGQKRPIISAITRTWRLVPHPSLVLALKKQLMDEAPARRLKRIEALAAANPEHIESHVALAEAFLDDTQYDKARHHLKIALSKQETPRICKLMARLEEVMNKNQEKANEWLERAEQVTAPAWICENCKHPAEKWTLHCSHCDGFDALIWQTRRIPYAETAQGLPAPQN